MLQAIRDRATGWVAYTIIFLICIPFALWGINSYFGDPAIPDVAQVGGVAITQPQFQQAYQRQRSRAPNVNEVFLKQQVLQQLVDEQVLSGVAASENLALSDLQLNTTIRSLPVFQQGGAFDTDRYQRVLLQQGQTPVSFELSLRDSIVIDQLRQGILNTAFIPTSDLRRHLQLQNQTRDFEYLLISTAEIEASLDIEASEIEQYFEENKDRFLTPEQVSVEYLELTLEQIADAIPLTDDDVKAAYQEQIDLYTSAEERRASHILVAVAEDADETTLEQARKKAQELHNVLQSGEKSFDELLADSQTQDDVEGGELGFINKGMMEASFEEALFALDEIGAISPLVKTGFGFHLIKLDEIIAEKITSYDEVKESLTEDMRMRQAEPEFYDAADTLANLSFEYQDSLQTAAETLGLTIQQSDWLERNGTAEGIGRYPQVITAAFSPDVLQDGANSEVIEVEPGHLVVLRLLEHQQAEPLTLDEARSEIVTQIKRQKTAEQADELADELLKQATEGKTMSVLAEENGLLLNALEGIERNADNIDGSLLSTVFRLPIPQAGQPALGKATLANGNRAVVKILAVMFAEEETITDSTSRTTEVALRQQIGVSQFQGFLGSQRQQAEITTFPDRL